MNTRFSYHEPSLLLLWSLILLYHLFELFEVPWMSHAYMQVGLQMWISQPRRALLFLNMVKCSSFFKISFHWPSPPKIFCEVPGVLSPYFFNTLCYPSCYCLLCFGPEIAPISLLLGLWVPGGLSLYWIHECIPDTSTEHRTQWVNEVPLYFMCIDISNVW